ncbi:hypothetical protein BABINDRAFT_161302 [Babjeviella inositovora NRRL Y-12698]|uniref:LicD/FKTN/FKRP nucleotidyltransferase domain-containing protein n=1 Tax=Babjeviella inositovora NRRL Y-12698 TaxID=984486 RepID=A0A1E3QRP4_9ASCO|nr:uncharacterized protein BABINDRAFT_161302 [Babjeviella inositovora NRRL Y-12698]ODQ80351.1 hypothetical protein BABINDRAFT_161302 [Babjeviella inositovora NRRL Y-12698]
MKQSPFRVPRIRRRRVVVALLTFLTITALTYASLFSKDIPNVPFNSQKDLYALRIFGKSREPISLDLLLETKSNHLETLVRHNPNRQVLIPSAYFDASAPNPQLLEHNIHFTLGVYLHHIVNAITQAPEMTLSDITVPFHWVDWVDMGDIFTNSLLLSAKEKPLCADIASNGALRRHVDRLDLVHRPFGPVREAENDFRVDSDETEHDSVLPVFCMNDEGYSKFVANDGRGLFHSVLDYVKKGVVGERGSEVLSPGFHVSSPGNAGGLGLSTMYGKSYLFSFAPPPVSLIFLVENLAYEVPVKQEQSQKLMLTQNGLIEEYVSTKQYTVDSARAMGLFQSGVPALKVAPELLLEKELLEDMFQFDAEQELKTLEETQGEYELVKTARFKRFLETKPAVDQPRHFNLPQLEHTQLDSSMYDWRFFNAERTLPLSATHTPALVHGLITAWLHFAQVYEFHSWLASGSLLAWYWNGLVFPWDSDLDVQVPVATLYDLAHRFNNTLICHNGDVYLFEVGGYIQTRERDNANNKIDARFIDTKSGVYVDVMALSVSGVRAPERYTKAKENPENTDDQDLANGQSAKEDPEKRDDQDIADGQSSKEDPGKKDDQNLADGQSAKNIVSANINYSAQNTQLKVYNCRNHHFASLNELSPLSLTLMNGAPAYVPHKFWEILEVEYKGGMESMHFESHVYLPLVHLWVPETDVTTYLEKYNGQFPEGDARQKESSSQLNEADLPRMLAFNKRWLEEYAATYEFTEMHDVQMMSREGKGDESPEEVARNYLDKNWNPKMEPTRGRSRPLRVLH